MKEIIDYLKLNKLLNATVDQFTFLVDENLKSNGVLITVPFRGKFVKLIIPAPHHEELFQNETKPSYQEVLNNKHGFVLK